MQAKPITLQADIYSYAIMVWELITLQLPYKQVKGLVQLFETVVTEQGRPDLGLVSCDELKFLLEGAWAQQPQDRCCIKSMQRHLMATIVEEQENREARRRGEARELRRKNPTTSSREPLKRQSSMRKLWRRCSRLKSDSTSSVTESTDCFE